MSHEDRKRISRQEAGRLLESAGRQLIEKGEIEIWGTHVALPEDIEVEIEYKRKEGKNKFEIELRWYGSHYGSSSRISMGTELSPVSGYTAVGGKTTIPPLEKGGEGGFEIGFSEGKGTEVVKIASLAECSPWKTIQFSYPAGSDRAILIVMPDMELRAYSTVCTHKGKSLLWDDQLKRLHCPAHDAVFSAETGEKISGPGGSFLKKIHLQVREGDIFAVGIDQ